MKQTLTAGLVLLAVGIAPAQALESPYLPLAATGYAVVLVEKDRVKLEKEFVPLLESNGRSKYVVMYSALDSSSKEKIAKCYATFKDKGLDERRILAGVSLVIESAFGMRNARIIIRDWSSAKKYSGVEFITAAPKIKNAAKLAPEILQFYDVAELEEIDRLQKDAVDAIIAANRQAAAASEQRTAALRKENERLDAMLKRLGALLEKN